MIGSDDPYITTAIQSGDLTEDSSLGFSSGEAALDDYFRRHALTNQAAGIGRAYVLRREGDADPALPKVLGFYTLSMGLVASSAVADVVRMKLPRYPMPVGLIGRLAIDHRVQGRGFGERLLMDASRRVLDASEIMGCIGIVVDAKHEAAERFYAKYAFTTLTTEAWPRRMFLAMATLRAAFVDDVAT